MKKTDNKLIYILCTVAAICAICAVCALCIPREAKIGEFTPPAFDENAKVGVPTVADTMGYTELYKEGMTYKVSLCGVPSAGDGALTVFFTSPETNEKYLKLRVFDSEGNVLGDTGIIRPGEYVEEVKLTESLSSGDSIKLKIMGYEPETYESAGSVTLNVTVG